MVVCNLKHPKTRNNSYKVNSSKTKATEPGIQELSVCGLVLWGLLWFLRPAKAEASTSALEHFPSWVPGHVYFPHELEHLFVLPHKKAFVLFLEVRWPMHVFQQQSYKAKPTVKFDASVSGPPLPQSCLLYFVPWAVLSWARVWRIFSGSFFSTLVAGTESSPLLNTRHVSCCWTVAPDIFILGFSVFLCL